MQVGLSGRGSSKWRQCIVGCGVFFYWLPRVVLPLAIVWGTVSHAVYTLRLRSVLAQAALGPLGVMGGMLALVAYFRVWTQGPGTPLEFEELVVGDAEQSAGFDPETHTPQLLQDSVEARYDGSVRFCRHCNVFKPDRTHHCRQCGVCVLRMDHHCPWFTMCVGLRNHKYFIQFLWYVWVLCICADCVGVPWLVAYFRNQEYETTPIDRNLVFYTLIAGLFVLIITFFGTYTTVLAVQNRTTLESLEAVPYRTSLPASQWRYRYPPTRDNLGNVYDIGRINNLNQLFGTTWAEWLLPITSRLPTDGRSYPFSEDIRRMAEERAQTEIAMLERKRMLTAAR